VRDEQRVFEKAPLAGNDPPVEHEQRRSVPADTEAELHVLEHALPRSAARDLAS
jgi:hypothetical protein